MKKLVTIIAAFSVLAIFNSCSKEAPEPELNSIEKTNLVQGTCRNYWFYAGSQPFNLGNPMNNKIRIGFKKGTNQAKQFMIIKEYPQLNTIINPSQNTNETKVDVSLIPNLSCSEIGDLLDELVSDNHIDYANPYFFPNLGYDNSFIVMLAPQTTMTQLNNLIKSTKTEYVQNLSAGYGSIHVIKTTKHSAKNCLDMTNQFYETGLFDSSEPGWQLVIDD